MKNGRYSKQILIFGFSILLLIMYASWSMIQNYDLIFIITLSYFFILILAYIFGFKEIDLRNGKIKR